MNKLINDKSPVTKHIIKMLAISMGHGSLDHNDFYVQGRVISESRPGSFNQSIPNYQINEFGFTLH